MPATAPAWPTSAQEVKLGEAPLGSPGVQWRSLEGFNDPSWLSWTVSFSSSQWLAIVMVCGFVHLLNVTTAGLCALTMSLARPEKHFSTIDCVTKHIPMPTHSWNLGGGLFYFIISLLFPAIHCQNSMPRNQEVCQWGGAAENTVFSVREQSCTQAQMHECLCAFVVPAPITRVWAHNLGSKMS